MEDEVIQHRQKSAVSMPRVLQERQNECHGVRCGYGTEAEKGLEQMTIHMIKGNVQEAKLIQDGDLRFLIRSDRESWISGDLFNYQPYLQGKPIEHPVARRTYKVTGSYRHTDAPVEKGWQIIAFKEVDKWAR